MAVILGLAVAATYGAADFLGGLSSKRSSVMSVVVLSQASSLVLLAVLLVVDNTDAPRAGDVGLGAVAGTIGCSGLLLLYRGLALGRMSVVAPVTAVGAAVVPLAWAIATGERPSILALAGVALALCAVVLIARSSDDHGDHGDHAVVRAPGFELALATAAGTCFGVVFILLGNTSEDSGFWPLAGARPTSVAVLVAGGLVARQQLRPARSDVPSILGAGVLDMTANALFLLAVRRGLLSLVAVLGSLYPAATVLLARLVLRERITAVQGVGLALAGAGVTLIAAG